MNSFFQNTGLKESDLNAHKAWIVERDDVFQFILKESLMLMGVSDIKTFDDGRDAIKDLTRVLAQSSSFPDCIFLDHLDPILNGQSFLELCDSLHSASSTPPPCIYLTSKAPPEKAAPCFHLIKAHIPKSSSFQVIQKHLLRALDERLKPGSTVSVEGCI